jgi:TatA/E family protein of Tat protein translocase
MFGISGEHLLILGIVLLIFGPKRLPELGNTMGKAIRNFKDALSGVEEAKFRRISETAEAEAKAKAAAAPSMATAETVAAPRKTDSSAS